MRILPSRDAPGGHLVLGDDPVAELRLGHLVAPVPEGPFRELHDVALVDERHGLALVVDRVLDRHADQPLRARLGDRLDADARIGTDALAHLARQELDDALGLRRALRPLDAGVDVFGVLAEDDHVHQLGALDRRRRALEVADRPHAGIQVEDLAQRDVDAADAAADRRGQRALDGDLVGSHRLERVVREPLAELLFGLFARRDLEPGDLSACRRTPCSTAASKTRTLARQMSGPVPSPSI